MVLPGWDALGRVGQTMTTQIKLSWLVPNHLGDLQQQGAGVAKGFPSCWYLCVLTQVLVEPWGLG